MNTTNYVNINSLPHNIVCYTEIEMKSLKKLSPSPIIEAVTEIRFNGNLPSEVIFGKLYAALSGDFSETEQLPILEAPIELRDRPEFKYAPHYRLKNSKYLINISSRMISVNQLCADEEYSSWGEYSKNIRQVLKEVEDIDLIDEVSRVAVRYINFFEEPADKVLNLKLSLFDDNGVDFKKLALSFSQTLNDNKELKVEVRTGAQINSSKRFLEEGLIVTFEAYVEKSVKVADLFPVIDNLHADVKQAFVPALNSKFLESLKPEYE